MLKGMKDAIRQSSQKKNAQSIRVVAATRSEAMIFDLLTSYPKQWLFGQKWLLGIMKLLKGPKTKQQGVGNIRIASSLSYVA
jgi:hypothetical protein